MVSLGFRAYGFRYSLGSVRNSAYPFVRDKLLTGLPVNTLIDRFFANPVSHALNHAAIGILQDNHNLAVICLY